MLTLSKVSSTTSGCVPSTEIEQWSRVTGPQNSAMAVLLAGMFAGTGGALTLTPAVRPLDSTAFVRIQTPPPPAAVLAETIANKPPVTQLSSIRRYFSLNVTELARVLRVERPTVYAWLSSKTEPHQANMDRIGQVYQLARKWRQLSALPIGSFMHAPIEGSKSLLDALSQGQIDELAIEEALARIQAQVGRTRDARPSLAESASRRGFSPVSEDQQQRQIDDETVL
jgi:hypothetical protein